MRNEGALGCWTGMLRTLTRFCLDSVHTLESFPGAINSDTRGVNVNNDVKRNICASSILLNREPAHVCSYFQLGSWHPFLCVRAFPIPESCGEQECLGSYANGLLPSIIQQAGHAIVSVPRPVPVTVTVHSQANVPSLFFLCQSNDLQVRWSSLLLLFHFYCPSLHPQTCDFHVSNKSASPG